MNNKQKDIEIFLEKNNKNYYEENSNYFSMIKLWYSIKNKHTNSRNKKKLQSSMILMDILEQNSDNESDKTEFEKNIKYDNRERKANSKKCNNINKLFTFNKPKYLRKESLNIKRINFDNYYEIVLPH
jgi:hypothetical protein|tara:strand:+ start:1320 stop:1703 length:384 start_codon:yes stop_codon:yes gene_type:complete